MAEILVIHRDLMLKGGAEAVCMNAIEALQGNHSVTLVTTAEPDIDELNEYYHTSLSEEDLVVDVFFPGRALADMLPVDIELLQWSLFHRYVRKYGRKFDLVINTTASDIAFPYETIQYIHNPRPFYVHSPPVSNLRKYIFYKICEQISGFNKELFQGDTILTNSEWTSQRARECYGCSSEVVYPPVASEEFYEVPWTERGSGFVSIGRIEPSKNILENIEILSKIRQLGHEVHYHIVGPPGDKTYHERIKEESQKYDYIHLEGEVSREELIDLICTHRYGIHGKNQEHFGMAVAEMVAGGMIPFVPDDGGQCDVVGSCAELIYSSAEEAVEKIHSLLLRPEKARQVRDRIINQEKFSRDKFKQNFKYTVNKYNKN